jgi:hypothetical protein
LLTSALRRRHSPNPRTFSKGHPVSRMACTSDREIRCTAPLSDKRRQESRCLTASLQ